MIYLMAAAIALGFAAAAWFGIMLLFFPVQLQVTVFVLGLIYLGFSKNNG